MSSVMGTFVKFSQLKPCMLPALLLVLGADAAAGIGAVAACLPRAPGAGTGTTGDSVLGTSFGDDMLGPGGGCIGLLGMLNLNAIACKSEPEFVRDTLLVLLCGIAHRSIPGNCPAPHMGDSGMDDFGSSGAGIFGSSGFATAETADSVFSCGCSGSTLNKTDKVPAEPASPLLLVLSASAASPPASSPLFNAFSRLPAK
jgi:hypothetical protein